MGVKDLWPILQPICERKSLWELQDKIIAIDLSCWICDSQLAVKYSTQPNLYLRNIFFRTSVLLMLGATPIFVLDGVAPQLKAAVMQQRNVAQGFSQVPSSGSQPTKEKNTSRSHHKSVQKKCCKLFECLGVKYIQSDGEAEALCAILNKMGLVAGCISQDSDCFLYGAGTVYRNFTIGNSSTGGPGFSIDCYSMALVEERVGLTRNKLIALSLLCGCDYNQEGVSGVGKESALKFISSVPDNKILDRLRQWRYDDYLINLEVERDLGGCDQCGHLGGKKIHLKNGCEECKVSKRCIPSFNPQSLCQMEPEQKKSIILELNIRKKALKEADFPSEQIITEFLEPSIAVPSKLDTKWEQPDIIGFLRVAGSLLNWEETYSFAKFFPILTRWVLVQTGNDRRGGKDTCPVYPLEIKKTRVLQGIPSYEIQWADTAGLFDAVTVAKTQDSDTDPDPEPADMFCTIEPKTLVEKAYPDLVQSYTTRIEEAKKAKRKGKSKSTKASNKNTNPDRKLCTVCEGSEGCLCQFTQIKSKSKPAVSRKGKKGPTPKDTTKCTQTSLSPFIQKSVKEKLTLREMSLEESFNTSLILEDEEYDEKDLSVAVMEFVKRKTYSQDLLASPPQSIDSAHRKQPSPPQDLSDDDFQTHERFIDRVKKRMESSNCSPERKKKKDRLPYSPLAEYSCILSVDEPVGQDRGQDRSEGPQPAARKSRARKSILESKSSKRFSISLQEFSMKEPLRENSLHLDFDLFMDCTSD